MRIRRWSSKPAAQLLSITTVRGKLLDSESPAIAMRVPEALRAPAQRVRALHVPALVAAGRSAERSHPGLDTIPRVSFS
jgi:hypothetical protein